MEQCPLCGEDLIEQPTMLPGHRQFKCGGYRKLEGGRTSMSIKCKYIAIVKDGKTIFEDWAGNKNRNKRRIS